MLVETGIREIDEPLTLSSFVNTPKIYRNSFPQGSHRLYRGAWPLSGGTRGLMQRIKYYVAYHRLVTQVRTLRNNIHRSGSTLFTSLINDTLDRSCCTKQQIKKKKRNGIGIRKRPSNLSPSTFANQNIELTYQELLVVAAPMYVAPSREYRLVLLITTLLSSHGN